MASKIALELHLLQSSKFFNRVSSTNLQITQLFSGFKRALNADNISPLYSLKD